MKLESVRKKAKRLRSILKGSRRAAILIYGNPDPDALGSAWGLQRILRKWGVIASIFYTGRVGRLENEAMIEYLRIPASKLKPGTIEAKDLVAVVDAQPSFFSSAPLPRCDIVFDHHPPRGPGGSLFTEIRPSCLATSSIVTEYMAAAGCRLDWRIATALFYGIVTDARHSNRPRTGLDDDAMRRLEPRIDRRTVTRIEYSAYSLPRLDYFAIAIMRLRHHHGLFCANVGPVPVSDVCSQIADFLIRVKEARWAVVIGVFENTLIVVFRCVDEHGNAGRTATAAFGKLGSAGGHATMGRAEVPVASLPKGMLLTQGERIERFVLERLAATRKIFKPLLDQIVGLGNP